MFEGVYPALITPFKDNSQKDLDLEGLESNIEYLISCGVHGIVPCGSTGESATLTFEEHETVIEKAVEVADGRVPVLAGTGSNNTVEAVRFTKAAKDIGADGVLVLSPYYNKPNRSGLVKHYNILADLDIPVVVYNIPGRTGQNLAADLIVELAENPNIVAVKEASGNLEQMSRIIEDTRDLDFTLLSGDDGLTLPILALGGKGVISVTANIAPKLMVQLYEQFKAGDIEGARKTHYRIAPLSRALFIETNPIPVKTASGLKGHAGGPVRLPLDEMAPNNLNTLKEVLKNYD